MLLLIIQLLDKGGLQMALAKRNYVSGETVITAKNLNEIQDSIIALEGTVGGDGETWEKLVDASLAEAGESVTYTLDNCKRIKALIAPMLSGSGVSPDGRVSLSTMYHIKHLTVQYILTMEFALESTVNIRHTCN